MRLCRSSLAAVVPLLVLMLTSSVIGSDTKHPQATGDGGKPKKRIRQKKKLNLPIFNNFSTPPPLGTPEDEGGREAYPPGVQIGELHWDQLPSEHVHTSEFYLQRQILPAKAAREVIDTLRDIDFTFDLDSVDEASTFEFWLSAPYNKETPEFSEHHPEKREEVLDILRPYIEHNVMPLVKSVFPGKSVKPCFSFIRRYTIREDEERMRHPTHFDSQAYATMVVSLNTFGKDFTGGLYVATSDVKRHYLNLTSGDGAIHQSDLLHGVQVFSGTRWSWIQWFSGPDGKCNSDPRKWNVPMTDPEQGNSPLHQYLLARQIEGKQNAEAGTPVVAWKKEYLRWMRLAAHGGFPRAQYEYGNLLLEENRARLKSAFREDGDRRNRKTKKNNNNKRRRTNDEEKAQKMATMTAEGTKTRAVALEAKMWFEKAAAGGESEGLLYLAGWYNEFPHTVDSREQAEEITMKLFKQACDEGSSSAGCQEYATALFDGTAGLDADPSAALEIFHRVSTVDSLHLAFQKVSEIVALAAEQELDATFELPPVPKSLIESANRALAKAARMGHPASQFMYAKKRLEEVDEQCPRAIHYLQVAAYNGHEGAQEILETMGLVNSDGRPDDL